jgi:hypothetical protein
MASRWASTPQSKGLLTSPERGGLSVLSFPKPRTMLPPTTHRLSWSFTGLLFPYRFRKWQLRTSEAERECGAKGVSDLTGTALRQERIN